MSPFVPVVLEYEAESGIIVIQMDQTHIGESFELLIISTSWEGRALSLLWEVQETDGNIGFENQKILLDRLAILLAEGCRVVLVMTDRFYGTADLITYCQQMGWYYRLRLKNNLLVFEEGGETATGNLAKDLKHFYENILLTN